MKDFLENLEDAAERWADEHIVGDEVTCNCGRKFSLASGGNMISPNPYAIPVCNHCFEEWWHASRETNMLHDPTDGRCRK